MTEQRTDLPVGQISLMSFNKLQFVRNGSELPLPLWERVGVGLG
jgi:hypothetical protein